jgi:hypothetical protein
MRPRRSAAGARGRACAADPPRRGPRPHGRQRGGGRLRLRGIVHHWLGQGGGGEAEDVERTRKREFVAPAPLIRARRLRAIPIVPPGGGRRRAPPALACASPPVHASRAPPVGGCGVRLCATSGGRITGHLRPRCVRTAAALFLGLTHFAPLPGLSLPAARRLGGPLHPRRARGARPRRSQALLRLQAGRSIRTPGGLAKRVALSS